MAAIENSDLSPFRGWLTFIGFTLQEIVDGRRALPYGIVQGTIELWSASDAFGNGDPNNRLPIRRILLVFVLGRPGDSREYKCQPDQECSCLQMRELDFTRQVPPGGQITRVFIIEFAGMNCNPGY